MRKWKKLLSAMLAGMMCVSALGTAQPFVFAATTGTYEIYDGILHYEIREDGTAEITDFTQTTNFAWWISVKIPDEIEGAAVTSIADNVFAGCDSMNSLTLPGTIVSIGENAFANTYSFNVWYGGSYAMWNAMEIGSGNDYLLKANIEYTYDGMNYYILGDGTASLSGYDSAEGAVVLPDNIEGFALTEIHDSALYENTAVTEVTIPDGVTRIGEKAFFGCSGITDISIPESVVSIGSSAFSCCSSLTQIDLPDGITSIEASTFSSCTSLESFVIHEGITAVNDNAFNKCTKLQSITFPESLETLGKQALYNCTALDEVILPEDFVNFGKDVFPSTYLADKRLENGMGVVNNVVVDGSKCTGDVVIPDGIVGIADNVFSGSSITSITIPGSVYHLGSYAFSSCETLTTAVLEEGVPYVSAGMFYDCSELTDVTIPNTVTSIGASAFRNCVALTEITMSDTLRTVDEYAFYGCYLLKGIAFPETLESIGKHAFNGCIRLREAVLSEGLTELPESVFDECKSLSDINISENVTSIGKDALFNTRWLRTKLANDPFFTINGILIDGRSLAGIVELPDTVQVVNDYAFYGDSDITRINIPDSVTEIGCYTFSSCSALKSIYIPKSVTFIDYWTFHSSSISTIYYEGTEEDWANIQLDDSNAQELEDITIIYGASADNGMTYETGDIDGNASVDISDAKAVLDAYAQTAAGLTSELTVAQLAAADINGDGSADLQDVSCILSYYAQSAAGLEPSWEDIIGA